MQCLCHLNGKEYLILKYQCYTTDPDRPLPSKKKQKKNKQNNQTNSFRIAQQMLLTA